MADLGGGSLGKTYNMMQEYTANLTIIYNIYIYTYIQYTIIHCFMTPSTNIQ